MSKFKKKKESMKVISIWSDEQFKLLLELKHKIKNKVNIVNEDNKDNDFKQKIKNKK